MPKRSSNFDDDYDNDDYDDNDNNSIDDEDDEDDVNTFNTNKNKNKKFTTNKPPLMNAIGGGDKIKEDIDEDDDDDDDEDSDSDVNDVSDDDNDDIVVNDIHDDESEDDNENESDAENDDDDDDEKEMEDEPPIKKKTSTKSKDIIPSVNYLYQDDDDEDNEDDNYLQKFDNDLSKNYINDYHPECYHHNFDEIIKMSRVVRDANNIIIDPLHRTIPCLTKYERTRVLGQRAKQIESGSKPFVSVSENIIDSYIIAELELAQKKIPFIIRRPIPNGGFEYWNLKDLEIIAF
jgi:DNA-directed RNA polymerase subunit K/omega